MEKIKEFLLSNFGVRKAVTMISSRRDFRLVLDSQAIGGMLLFVSAILAIVIANSSNNQTYQNFLSTCLNLNLPSLSIYKEMNLKLWIDDFLMAIFFLLVGLELKREILIGELSSKEKVILPVFAALGGVIFPILIFLSINFNHPENLAGAAIPAATDIAFAIAILSLFGNKISHSLKIFLVALAIIDDLIAILIIAIFYTDNLDLTYLNYALMAAVLLFILNVFKIKNLIPYMAVAPFLWIFVLKSGIHATIAGIALAMFIPFNREDHNNSPAHFLERILHAPVSYLILPIFAFANSGIVFADLSFEIVFDKLVLGIILGLFLGKQIGIALVAYILNRMKICSFFSDIKFIEFYGVAILAGIGFTMSLFIGNLAFDDIYMINKVKVGVILGSLLSAIAGCIILKIAIKAKAKNA